MHINRPFGEEVKLLIGKKIWGRFRKISFAFEEEVNYLFVPEFEISYPAKCKQRNFIPNSLTTGSLSNNDNNNLECILIITANKMQNMAFPQRWQLSFQRNFTQVSFRWSYLRNISVHTSRVARWYIFKPKIPVWVNCGGSCNGWRWYI
jgi:hypothetical protein